MSLNGSNWYFWRRPSSARSAQPHGGEPGVAGVSGEAEPSTLVKNDAGRPPPPRRNDMRGIALCGLLAGIGVGVASCGGEDKPAESERSR